jgi:hypothetical protein
VFLPAPGAVHGAVQKQHWRKLALLAMWLHVPLDWRLV